TKIISRSLLIPLVAVPMTIFLYIFLPRTSYPVLNFLNRGGGVATTGFTDQVRLGTVSSIQENSAIIFRAGMEKINDDSLYWRGIVLDYFDGASWKSTSRTDDRLYSFRGIAGKRVVQAIYLEPYENKYFFALDLPLNISLQHVQRRPDMTFFQDERISRRIKYYAWSSIAEILPEKNIERALYLQLPQKIYARTGRHEKIEDLAKRLAVRNNTEATIKAVFYFLKNGNYRYSLNNLPQTSQPVEDFLFKYRYGNCEYFASAMAVMLRMNGIPARLIGGYRGGYYNEMGKYYLVPEKNAHVWVEAYIDHKGWVRADPTPMDTSRFGSGPRKDLFFRARILFDAINYAWNASVINYDLEGQLSILAAVRAGIKRPVFHFSPGKFDLIKYLLFVCVTFAGLYACFVVLSWRKAPDQRIISLFLKKTGRLGFVKIKSEGLEEFVMRIDDAGMRERALVFVKEFERYYYRDEEISPGTSKRLRNLIKDI
ncbi:MAG: DUF3488 domain-containing protein, partial [Nitrospirae bacterium]|nr:DUF3488 domain-containing protein [Nitrospirota bacterium]